MYQHKCDPVNNIYASVQVYNNLTKMAGVTVYKHEDIPEQFHIKESKYVYDIILVADTGESCEYF